MFLAWQLADGGELDRALALTEPLRSLTESSAFATIACGIFSGWARLQHDPVAAAADLQRVATFAKMTGPQMFEPLALLVLTDAHLATGARHDAADAAAAAAAIAAAEMPFHVPEALRRLGMIRCLYGDRDGADTHLQAAVATAAAHGNLAHEARARVALLAATRAGAPSATVQRRELARLCGRFPADSHHGDLLQARRYLAT